MKPSLKAGLTYFAAMFAIAGVVSLVREMILTGALPDVVILAIEIPVLFIAAWILCRSLIERFDVPSQLGARAVMGLSALILWLIADVAVSSIILSESVADQLELQASPFGQLKFYGQLLFAVFPLAQVWDSNSQN